MGLTPEAILDSDCARVVPGLAELAARVIEHAPPALAQSVEPDWWNNRVVLRDSELRVDVWIAEADRGILLHHGFDGVYGTEFRNGVMTEHSEATGSGYRIEACVFATIGYFLCIELGKGKHIDVEATRAHINDGSLFEWLDAELGFRTSTGWLRAYEKAIAKVFDDVSGCHSLGIEDNGLVLLASYCFEKIGQYSRLTE